ncbi:MAG: CRISPR system precrRNA processing endoribonuclease RAMP protein Cas6 [Promethearchaeota archaeon]
MIILTFELYPEDGQINFREHPYGYIFRGVIMAWLAQIKPEIVHELHEDEKIRPYSINYTIDKKTPKIDFRIVTYMDKLSQVLIEDLLSDEKPLLKFGEKNYYISKINFERINLRILIESAKPVRSFNIRFYEPVYFNTSKGDYPVRFPIPELLFGNLANIWNDIFKEISEVDRENLLKWINAHLYVSGYNMKSIRRTIGKPIPVVGGLGNITFRVSKINSNYYKHYLDDLNRTYDYEFVNDDFQNNCHWLEILCKLGEYTNVGANRTAGMGAIRYYPKEYLSAKDLLSKNF